jgi:hypothetical protein
VRSSGTDIVSRPALMAASRRETRPVVGAQAVAAEPAMLEVKLFE